MDCKKVGNLIYQIRKEKGYTQNQIALALNISNKTVSKWENGLGCPDVSVLNDLSAILGVDLEQILNGKLKMNKIDNGNMKNTNIYVCPNCGNIITSTGKSNVSCCSRKLSSLVLNPNISNHDFTIEEIDMDYYIHSNHPMNKDHYISFIIYLGLDKIVINKMYPEQSCEVRIPITFKNGKILGYCTKDGLFKIK